MFTYKNVVKIKTTAIIVYSVLIGSHPFVVFQDTASLTAVHEQLIFVSTISGKFYAVSKKTGQTLWTLDEGKFVCVRGNRQYAYFKTTAIVKFYHKD